LRVVIRGAPSGSSQARPARLFREQRVPPQNAPHDDPTATRPGIVAARARIGRSRCGPARRAARL